DVYRVEELLQAVIIVDSYDERFRPITNERSCAFMPLVDKYAIDYTIEMLINSGLRKILVIVSRHTQKISKYIKESHFFLNNEAEFEIMNLSSDCQSMGDIFREIDRDPHSHLRGEFIVISGMAVCKSNIRELIDRHMRRRIKDDRVILTTIFHSYPPCTPIKDIKRDVFMVSDVKTKEILHIDPYYKTEFSIPSYPLFRRPCFDVHFDLNYSGIYFFDTRALQLFTDNYDFQTVDDLMQNIIGDEIIQKAVCYDVCDSTYIGTIMNLKLFMTVSFDVLERWSYPTNPDRRGYTIHPNQVYMGSAVDVDRSAKLRAAIAIGANTFVGHKVVLECSIIGKNCYVGSNTTIINSHIWSNVRIEANCYIENSIICDNVSILPNTEISKGCLLSFGVIVGPNTIIPAHTIIHVPVSSQCVHNPTSIIDLGIASNGSIFQVYDCDLPNYDLDFTTLRKVKKYEVSSDSDEDGDKDESTEKDDDFNCAIRDTLLNGILENVPVDTIITEVKVAKSTFNVTVEILNITILNALGDFCISEIISADKNNINGIQERVTLMAPFCKSFYHKFNLLAVLFVHLEGLLYAEENLKKFYVRLILCLFSDEIIDIEFLTQLKNYDSDTIETERQEFRLNNINRFLSWAESSNAQNQMNDDESESE
ncbi:hypothetical protein HZS_1617, partial [Henneguya salminicola]